MIYYDNAFRLRIRHTSVYQIHQHLDFFMQERKGEKLPYSFKIFPGTGDDSLLLVRTATALELPGEKKRELILSEGHEIKFITSMAIFHKGTKSEGRGRRQFAPSDEASYQLALTKLAKAGFKPGQIAVSGPKIVHIDKGNAGRGFTLPVFTVQGTAIISNQQEAEVGIVYGVGPKRVFGCGFMHLAGQ
ncbi:MULTISPECIES: type I-E CRISPR-associated protein Cas6/Cse3/CasE [Klebsiella]|uniref:CRISPR associated protein n=1 Tax=Klebsiella variicola TaxID=244366 RepID=A0ABD7PB97_KLEVA|nr:MULTISPECIES: type I-E CRISPR-associated protein Cas6/Cse3/CasE [Klebsiella]HBC8618990.1 type I-E CRISPR-associated protein Cas6/Cse3/CasE [Klebsiella oxytoca]EKR5521794.1 type I-E CRISPR-associated protein Cas6/Cse3/CasE [Klebsiella pneumoniae]EKV5680126.1 type I-E CRISPR-associated protein Cas6/Cse3/CasE [Klebsiella pneumoniae]EKW2063871.1 type I-E CRISPR-associated protein Cas6/Cse3/CasE [Klebsiella pneumoniae]EKZ6732444.1 type I-E CRISPR-associated protein Cas6/Cse3/CasE [Klebsiella pne